MSITCKDVADRVAILANDTGHIRWTAEELILWINDSFSEMVTLKSNVLVKRNTVKLVHGSKQTIPSDCVRLLEVSRNYGTQGVTPGSFIRPIVKDILDVSIPGWDDGSTIASSATVKYATISPSDLNTYFVYPPQPAASQGYIEIVYAKVPNKMVALSDVIDPYVPDTIINAIVDYVLYRSYSKDAEISANMQRGVTHYQLFKAGIGVSQPQQSQQPQQQGGQ